MILKIYTDDRYDQGIDVPVTPQSTVSDVIGCCREPGNSQCHLVETWRNHERIVGSDERLFEILMHWGVHQDEVRFRLQLNRDDNVGYSRRDGYSSSSVGLASRPGANMTYEEMQLQVARQQQLIRQQQQMILAKEQRIRFLRQQEQLRNQQLERSQTRQEKAERVERYERKLRQLKGSRGEVFNQTSMNNTFTNELDSYKQVFNETERELSSAIAKADVLAKQLQDFENIHCEPSISEECQRLRSELIRQKKLNQKQNEQLTRQTKTLSVRKEEVAELDARIADLQNRLRHSALQRQNGKNATRHGSSSAVVATVEPYVQENVRNPPAEILGPSKQDPRYQSLLPEKRLSPGGVQKMEQGSRVKAENSALPGQSRLWNQDAKQQNRVPTAGNVNGDHLDHVQRMKPDTTSFGQHPRVEDKAANYGSVSVPPSSTSSEGYSSFPSSSSTRHQSKVEPTIAVSLGPTEIIATAASGQTITMENGPVFERFPTPTVEIPPTRYMPPFTAALVFPPKTHEGFAPVYTVASGQDARQGAHTESATFHRSSSGRYHFGDSRNEPSGGTRPGNTINQSANVGPLRRDGSPHGPQRVVDRGNALGGGDGKGNQGALDKPKETRMTNDFLPTTHVEQHALHVDSSGKHPHRHRALNNGSPQLIEQGRFQASEHKMADPVVGGSPNISPNNADIYGRPSQLRFASMSVISNTYFRKPGSNAPDPKKGEGKSRSRRTRDAMQSASGATSLSPASPTALIRPMQSVLPSTANTSLSPQSDVGRAPLHPGYLATGRVTPMPAADNRYGQASGAYGAVNVSTSGAARNTPSISQSGAPPRYGPPPSSQYGYFPPYSSIPVQPGAVVNHEHPPFRSKRISFSDEHFIPTHDTLYQLDGYGAYYNSSRFAFDPERSPSHLKPNAPRPLRRRLSGESADESLSRPLIYQQRLAPSTVTNPIKPSGSAASMAGGRYTPSPEAFHRMDATRQSSSGFLSPAMPQNPLRHSVPYYNDPAARDSARVAPSVASRLPQGYAPTYSTVSTSAVVTSTNVATYPNDSTYSGVSAHSNGSAYSSVSAYPRVSLSPNVSISPNVPISSNVSISPNVSVSPNVPISPNFATYPGVLSTSTNPDVPAYPNVPTYPDASTYSNVPAYPNVSAHQNVPTYPDVPTYRSASPNPPSHESNAPVFPGFSTNADATMKNLSVLDVDVSSPRAPLSQFSLSPSSVSPVRSADTSPAAPSASSIDSLSPIIGVPLVLTGVDTRVPTPVQKDFVQNVNVIGALDESVGESEPPLEGEPDPIPLYVPNSSLMSKRSNLRKMGAASRTLNRVTFDPLVLLLDACLEGELETVMRTTRMVDDASVPNDEGITALHNAICAGHYDVVKFLVEFGCDVNAADTDGWTPLHCAASCNNLEMTRLLVENGASIFAVTTSDQETASQKCEREEAGYDGCSRYLLEMEEKLGKSNHGVVYAVYDYTAQNDDELSFSSSDKLTVLRRSDDVESQWWYSRHQKKEGYVPRNYLGAYPRVNPPWPSSK